MARRRVTKTKASRKLLKQLGRNVKDARLARNWTQKDLGNRLRAHSTLVSRIEQGRSNITLGTLEQIAKKLEVPMSDLLEF
jgi:transcriptional regulator with XRE-family HTH domain